MIVCGIVYLLLILWKACGKYTSLHKWIDSKAGKRTWWILCIASTAAITLFFIEMLGGTEVIEILRNTYGEGSHTEEFEVTIEGVLEKEPFQLEVQEQEYDEEQIQIIFEEMMGKLDKVILGENESFDRIEKDMNLVNALEPYPVRIRWEMNHYQVLDPEGRILQENTKEEGTIVELRGILSYREWEAVYTATAVVFPETKTGKAKWIQMLEDKVTVVERDTREDKSLSLPETLDGKKLSWKRKKDSTGYTILGLGVVCAVLLAWKEQQDRKDEIQRRHNQMERDYPDIVSKMALLLATGMTAKQAWHRVVQAYEEQREQQGVCHAYEEMRVSYNEMQGGVPESESYERFGRRCDMAVYMKFGAILSQNLRKGSKGLADLLRVESIQAFEDRKTSAKRKGEEASTKLMIPMIGMLAVVLLMVVVPAFLSMQI